MTNLTRECREATGLLQRVTAMFVTLDRLHSTLSRDAVVEVIFDVLTNFVGADQVALFDLHPSGAYLELVSSVGVDETPLRQVGFGEGLVGRIAASGRMFVNREPLNSRAMWEAEVDACVPLKIGRRLAGAIVIFGMQTEKFDFTQTDIQLMELLSRHAAIALYACSMHAANTN